MLRNCSSCQARIARRMGLCFQCVYDPGISVKLVVAAKKARQPRPRKERLHGCCANYPLPPVEPRRLPEPTTAVPGTDEKIKVLMRRFADGEKLWHPLDVR